MTELRPTARLAWRMTLAVVLISTGVMVAGTGYQLLREYRADIELVDGRLDQIGSSHLHALESSLWQADQENVRDQLEGMLSVLDVSLVELHHPDGTVVRVGEPPAKPGRVRSWALDHTYRGQQVPLGELRVTASLDRVQQRLSDRAWSIVGTELVRAAILAGAFLLLLHLLLSRHLIAMAHAAAAWAGGDLERPLHLDRRASSGRPDELGQLVRALETMRRQLAESLEGLEDRRDELEAEVQAQVGEIQARNRELASEVETRRQAEIALRDSEARLQLLISQFPGALWSTDESLRIRSVAGGRADLLFGPVTGGEPLDRALHAEVDNERIVALHREALNGDSAFEEISVDDHTLELRIEPLDDTAAPHLAGVALDITERRRLEEERLRARLLRSQKLESLGVLAGGVAHDFNNLLVGIMGNTSLALAQLEPGATGRKAIESAELAAERAADLTRQMLAFSGKGRFVLEPVDLGSLVEEMSRLLETTIPGNTTLRKQLAVDIPAVRADAAQMRQVVMNLITNAAEAIGDDSGVITIRTEVLEADADYLDSGFLDRELEPGPYVALEVSDTGRGMDAETRERMFDPFFTTKDTGHGLGMAATLGIIRGHDGTVRVYSEPGRGTAIKVLLPPASSPSLPKPTQPSAEYPDVQGKVILVVDDDDDVRDFAQQALLFGGAEVIAAPDGPSGIEAYKAHSERIDLVLLDMKMPGMSGLECYRALRRIQPEVKVLLSSGYNEQDATSEFAGRGLAGFVQKPYRLKSLLEMVSRVTTS
jgi:signal transduction histidine kinase/HAMP domain-containing protein